MSDNAEVIQGRLGWESGDVSEARVANLEPHPKNREIYGDTDDLDESFVESIREKGVLEPLVITSDKQVISGHRRLAAARQVGIDTVPVRISEFDDELAEREALVEFNRQREKTPGQIIQEAEELLEIQRQKGKDEMARGGRANEGSSNLKNHDSWDEVAETVGVSLGSLSKGKEVKDKAESDDEPEPVQEAAKEAWRDLEAGDESFNGAYTRVKDAERDAGDGSDIEQFTSQQTDEWSSPRELVEPLADAVGEFDLDPCSGAETSPFAENTYTAADDGLTQPWHGMVWVNPPYSDVAEWTEKAVAEGQKQAVQTVCYLCKGDSSTDWWQRAANTATVICAIDHRLSFGSGDNSAPFASHVFVFGDVSPQLTAALREHGTLLTTGWSQ